MIERPGYLARRVTRDDAAAIAALINAFDRAYLGDPDIVDAAEVAGWWSRSDLATDSVAYLTPDGELAAFGVIYPHGEDVLDLDGYVLPGHQGKGLGSALVEWHEQETRGRGHKTAHASTLGADRAGSELLAGRGFELVRHFYRMVIDLEEPPPPAVWPEGFEVATFRAGDEAALHAVIQASFADHWGHEYREFDDWVDYNVAREWWDPSLVYLVRHGSEVVSGEINAVRFGIGWIGSLGTLSAWRGKGLGRALLLHAFAEFHRRGHTRVGLAVDAGNETGATHLYEGVGMRVVWQADVWEKRV